MGNGTFPVKDRGGAVFLVVLSDNLFMVPKRSINGRQVGKRRYIENEWWKGLLHMFTPCIFKRGIIWVVFFVISMFVIPFFAEEDAKSPVPAAPQVQTK